MLAVKNLRSTKSGFCDHLPYGMMVANGVILNKDGSFTAAWKISGQDMDSSSEIERNIMAQRTNEFIARYGSGWMFHIDAVRVNSEGYPTPERSHFPDKVTRAIDDERRAMFQKRSAHFETSTVLTLTYMPPDMVTSKLAEAMYTTDDLADSRTLADKSLESFINAVIEFQDHLDNIFKVRRLGYEESETEFNNTIYPCTLLQHLQNCISGTDLPVNLPENPSFLDALLGEDFESGVIPKVGEKLIGIVSIDGFPQSSMPGILSDLDKLPMTYRWSTRFIALDPTEARSKLVKFKRKWSQKSKPFVDQLFKMNSGNVDQDALDMAQDSVDAMSEASSQMVTYGYYTSVIIIYSDNISILEEQLSKVKAFINNKGFVARIETINAVEAYFGSLPANGWHNIRRPMLHSMNLVDMLPLNSIYAGKAEAPCPFYQANSPPLMQVATSGSTPFRLNLHVDDVGHTLVFGPTGSGKSTFLALLAAQFKRYKGAQIFAFDKGRSLMPLTMASGGVHYDIGADDDKLLFSPFSRVTSDHTQAWTEEWIISILTLQGLSVTPAMRNEIHRAMNVMRHSDSARTISNFVTDLQDKEIREALEYYTISGTMGKLLDSEEDTLQSNSFCTFEMEELMDKGESALMPVLLYLFSRIEEKLTGAPSLIILDEAWIMLGHPAFRDKIRAWLKVLRKANCAVVLATQSLSDASRSGIMDVLTENCPTKILLPNPEAREENSSAFYRTIGLNTRQIEILSTATPKREYYVMSPAGKRLFEMEIGKYALSFVGASGADDIQRIRKLQKTYGDEWVSHWLQSRGIKNAY